MCVQTLGPRHQSYGSVIGCWPSSPENRNGYSWSTADGRQRVGYTQDLVVEKAQIPITKADGARRYCLSINVTLFVPRLENLTYQLRVQL